MFKDLKGKKLLIIGGINNLDDLVVLAHRNGVFVGVSDYNKDTYLKRIADASHEVDATDVDALVELCKKEQYDGVISNFVDSISIYVTEVAERLGFYVPFNREQLLMSNDKKYFKAKCIQYGVPVPKEYVVSIKDDMVDNVIGYPVIIKPVDSSGSKGITVCHTEKDLLDGFNKAISFSREKRAIVEEFIPFDEINVTYIIQDGRAQLAAIHDRYFNKSQDNLVRVPDLYIYPSRYTDIFLEKYDQIVIRMLEGIGLKNGSLFMQACVKDNQVYFYEAGMRLNGCKTYQILEVENNYNTLERLLSYALIGDMGEYRELNPKFRRWYATLNVLGKPGTTVNEFSGIEELESYPWLIQIARKYREGEKIPDSATGTLIQVTTRIHLFADTKEQLIERISIVNELYKLFDPSGNNVILEPHDLNEVSARLDYDL